MSLWYLFVKIFWVVISVYINLHRESQDVRTKVTRPTSDGARPKNTSNTPAQPSPPVLDQPDVGSLSLEDAVSVKAAIGKLGVID